jgi:hypothetical protein
LPKIGSMATISSKPDAVADIVRDHKLTITCEAGGCSLTTPHARVSTSGN